MVKVLVKILQIVPHLVNGSCSVSSINGIVSSEHLKRTVAGDTHNDGHRNTGFPRIGVERVAQVMNTKPPFTNLP